MEKVGMNFFRKVRRMAEKHKLITEKSRKREAQRRESTYRKSRSYTELFKTKEERDEYLNLLLDRYKKGETLTLREADILCSSLRPENRSQYSICDDKRFTWLYLSHFDAGINGYSLHTNEQDQLNDFATKWEAKIWADEMSADRIYIETRKETRDTIKKMRKSLDGLCQSEIAQKEKEIILRSKNTYIKVKRVLENLGANELNLTMSGEEVHIDEFTLIHSFFRHYSELTKQFDDKKSYFTPEIPTEQLPTILRDNILKPIEESGVFWHNLPQSIFIKYFGRLYRIYFNSKPLDNGNKTVKRVNTFFPVDQEKDLQASKKYSYRSIGQNLYVGVM